MLFSCGRGSPRPHVQAGCGCRLQRDGGLCCPTTATNQLRARWPRPQCPVLILHTTLWPSASYLRLTQSCHTHSVCQCPCMQYWWLPFIFVNAKNQQNNNSPAVKKMLPNKVILIIFLFLFSVLVLVRNILLRNYSREDWGGLFSLFFSSLAEQIIWQCDDNE